MNFVFPSHNQAGYWFNSFIAVFLAFTFILSVAAHPVDLERAVALPESIADSTSTQPAAFIGADLEKRTKSTSGKHHTGSTSKSTSGKHNTHSTSKTKEEKHHTHSTSTTKDGKHSEPKLPSTIEIKKKFKLPKGRTTPLFWSGVKGDIPELRRKFPKIIMDVDCYPENYAHHMDHASKDRILKFQKRYSEVFAQKVPGPDVYVLVPWATGPNKKRVFNSAEWPVLKERMAKGQIKNVWQLNPDNLDEKRRYEPEKYYPGLAKRLDIDPDNAPWDVNLDALAEAYEEQQNRKA